MNIFEYKSIRPQIDPSAYISPNVCLIGEVIVGANANIWYNSVIRADLAKITIGKNTNIQDGTVIHTNRNDGPTIVGDNVTIGHKVLLHACTIENNSFIGMNSTIMDRAIIQEFGFVAAGALVTPRKIVKSRELWAGSPAKLMRYLTDQEVEDIITSANNYVKLAKEYMNNDMRAK